MGYNCAAQGRGMGGLSYSQPLFAGLLLGMRFTGRQILKRRPSGMCVDAPS
jgi:hypothetical protein